VSVKAFQPSLIIVGTGGAALEFSPEMCSTRHSLALLANIGLGWKGLPGTNTGSFVNYSRKI
jgi:hypothetical protein